ncbi:MAG TPA: hypothetical protein VNT22_03560 [Baekduia sp.]|nr:hypothetical protein [Baekduia sp.]
MVWLRRAGWLRVMVSLALLAAGAATILLLSGRDQRRQDGLATDSRLAALGLTRNVPAVVRETCRMSSRQYDGVVFCPPIVPVGPIKRELRPGPVSSHPKRRVPLSYALDFSSPSLERFGGRSLNTNGGHWTFEAGTDPTLRLQIRPPNVQAPIRTESLSISGRPATLTFMPPYDKGGGYYGGHVVVMWSEDGATYQLSIHGHGNAPRAIAMAKGLIELQDR